MTENNVSHVVIAGGTGFLGQALARRLEAMGTRVVVISRHMPVGAYCGQWIKWDGQTVGDWVDALERADALVNLAGRTVDCRKTPDNCDTILRSRVDSVRAIGDAVARCSHPPRVWVQASTAHIYGDPVEAVCDESTASGYGLAPYVGRRWEAALDEACPEAMRRVVLRTSFVLGNSGGAFPVLKRLARLGLGGSIGSGKQWISWLHIDDMVQIFLRAMTDPAMCGIYNATAPHAATNKQFMRSLRRAAGVPVGLPAPGWMVRLGAATLIDTDPELALYGRNVIPKRLSGSGFVFKFPDLDDALRDLLAGQTSRNKQQAA